MTVAAIKTLPKVAPIQTRETPGHEAIRKALERDVRDNRQTHLARMFAPVKVSL